MNAVIEQWKGRLVTLSSSEKAELNHFLLANIDDEIENVEDAWEVEEARRVEEIREGRVVGRPINDLLVDLFKRYPGSH